MEWNSGVPVVRVGRVSGRAGVVETEYGWGDGVAGLGPGVPSGGFHSLTCAVFFLSHYVVKAIKYRTISQPDLQ